MADVDNNYKSGSEWGEGDAGTRSSPSSVGNFDSPELGTSTKNFDDEHSHHEVADDRGNGLEMAVERMFAHPQHEHESAMKNARLFPAGVRSSTRETRGRERERNGTGDTLRAVSAPPPPHLPSSGIDHANDNESQSEAILTASPQHSPKLAAADADRDGDPTKVQAGVGVGVPVPAIAMLSPSPTGNVFPPAIHTDHQEKIEQLDQPILRSPPLAHHHSGPTLAPLAIPDKPDLLVTSPTAVPRTATMRQDSTQAALDTVFSQFFDNRENRKVCRNYPELLVDRKKQADQFVFSFFSFQDSTDSMPSTDLPPSVSQALFAVPEHDLTISINTRRPPNRQRSKSDTYMTSPVSFDGPFSYSPGAGYPLALQPHPQPQPQLSQLVQTQHSHAWAAVETSSPSVGSIDPRELDGSGGGSSSRHASPLHEYEDSALLIDETDDEGHHLHLGPRRTSQAGPASSSRRRSADGISPYDASSQAQHLLLPPSPMRRSRSHGHRRGAQSEDYTAATLPHSSAAFELMPHEHPHGGHLPVLAGTRSGYGSGEPYYLPPLPAPLPPMDVLEHVHHEQYGYPPPLSHNNSYMVPPPPLMPGYAPYPSILDPSYAGYGSGSLLSAPGEDLSLEPSMRSRRRSSVSSHVSGSAFSSTSEVVLESKTTEATKQAARRRRKDPNAAKVGLVSSTFA